MSTAPLVVDFTDGDPEDRDLLGGKGAGLVLMTRLGLPVPPGFIVTTAACRRYLATGEVPEELWAEVRAAVGRLEARTGRRFGAGPVPLLVSVRSGAPVSMPGMMDTVLDLGVHPELIPVLIDWSGDAAFAYDVERRFLQMFGEVVLGVPAERFEAVLAEVRARRGVRADSELDAEDLRGVAARFRALIAEHPGGPHAVPDDRGAVSDHHADSPPAVPDDPYAQLEAAITAVFRSWHNRRAREYRRLHGIPEDLGTAAVVQMMVFGDLGEESGAGVAFTRDPATGVPEPYGEYLPRAQGEDVVAGIRTPLTLDDLAARHPDAHRTLLEVMRALEQTTRDMCDIEFTVERGRLWVLQTRAGKRTATAAVRIAVDMVAEGLIDREVALTRVEPASLEQLDRPAVAPGAPPPAARGVAASPGAAQGRAVFDADTAVAWAARGERVILVRPETTPDDIHGMAAADGILTARGGKTSHAAVVARGMGKPAVTGVAALAVDPQARTGRLGAVELPEGTLLTIDGTAGAVYVGEVPLLPPAPIPELDTLLGWADEVRRLGVRANADTAADAALARRHGAEGIGLARTEHMFLGDRLPIVQRIILTEDDDERARALAELRAAQVADFEGLLEAMDGLPVVVRLLDPPLHEFLPDRVELADRIAELALRRRDTTDPAEADRLDRDIAELRRLAAAVDRWREHDPMLGLRGVRLGVVVAHLYRVQIEAALEAVARRRAAGGDPRLELMVPLVATAAELVRIRDLVAEVVAELARSGDEAAAGARAAAADPAAAGAGDPGAGARAAGELPPVGTMIELPRAALVAGDIAAVADFFSFGTNDLTQMTFGLSRDDAERLFLRRYLDEGLLAADPFQTLDVEGVGRLLRLATEEGRRANPHLEVGVCGEHGGDPASIAFFHRAGLDYVSCSPHRVRGARLAAAQAALQELTTDERSDR